MDYKYQVINLQNLQDRPHPQGQEISKKKLNQILNKSYRWGYQNPLFYSDTGLNEKRVIPSNGMLNTNSFMAAFLNAYVNHGDIVLIPDEVWLMITFYISNYVDNNAEILRKKLVTHEGKMDLVVVQEYVDQNQANKAEKEWNNFFQSVLKLIRKNTNEGVVQAFECNFSTTTRQYKIISTAMIMRSFQKLFHYKRLLGGCGINNVYMAGIRDDWAKMIQKLQYMETFDVDGKLKKYISHMEVILKNFLLTFDKKPNVHWWNTVMKTSESRESYGGQEMQIQGWILHFFGIYKKQTMAGYPDYGFVVPIELINEFTNTKKNLVLVSNWVSVSKLNQRAYKPDVALSIMVKK